MENDVIAMLSLHSSPQGRLGERDTGGMSVFLLETAIGLGGRGYVVDIFTLEAGRVDTRVKQLSENVRLVSLPYRWGEKVQKQDLHAHLDSIFREYCHFNRQDGRNYSLVHSHYWLSGCVGRVISESSRIPHIMSFHTVGALKNESCKEENEPEIRLEQERMLAAECDRIIVSTEVDRKKLAFLYGMPENAFGVVPCGVNLDRFTPVPKDHARKRLDLQDGVKVLLAVGRYVPIKGMNRLLEAVSFLARENDVLFLMVGGDGPGSQQYKSVVQIAEELGIKQNVQQAGRIDQEDLHLYYSAADVFLVGSYYESFCLTALESLACGTPVIGSAVGCLPDVVVAGAGMVLDEPTGPNLAAAVKEFLNVASEERLLPSQLRELAFSYAWDRSVDALEEEYATILQKAGGSALE